MNKQFLKKYLLHFFLSVFSIVILLYILTLFLNKMTRHSDFVQTPQLMKMPIQEAIQVIQSKKLRYLITDSVYNPEQKPGVVISQTPEANIKVKENRIIYLTITGFQPPQISMPKLIDLSERQAIATLKSFDLKIGHIRYERSYCNGCVLRQLIKGKEVEPGKRIKKGSIIDIIVGTKGNNNLPTDTLNQENNSLDNNSNN